MFEESVSSVPSIWASMNSWFTPTVLFVLLNVMIGTIAYTSTLANQKQQQQQQKTQEDSHQQQEEAGPARSYSVLRRLKSIDFSIYRSKEPNSSVPSIADSDTHYSPQQTQQQQALETETEYVSRQTHQQQTLERETQYVARQTHLQQTLERETQLASQHTHQQQTLERETQFASQHTHQQQTQERETQFGSQHTHQQQTLETETTQYVPEEQTHGDEIGDDQQTIEEFYGQLTDHHVSRTMSDMKPASGEVQEKLPAKIRKSASMKSPFGHFSEEEIVEPRRPATVREAKVTEADEEVDSKADDFINKFRQQLKLQRLDSIIRYKDMIGRGTEK